MIGQSQLSSGPGDLERQRCMLVGAGPASEDMSPVGNILHLGPIFFLYFY